MSALTRLAEKVEAGTAADFQFYTFRDGMSGTVAETKTMIRAYNGSLDAAKALHEAVLPAMIWNMGHLSIPNLRYVCTVADGHFADSTSWRGYAMTPARAWLLAIIRALAQVQK